MLLWEPLSAAVVARPKVNAWGIFYSQLVTVLPDGGRMSHVSRALQKW